MIRREGHYRNKKCDKNFILKVIPSVTIAGIEKEEEYDVINLESGIIDTLDLRELTYFLDENIYVTDIEGIYKGYLKEYLRGKTNE